MRHPEKNKRGKNSTKKAKQGDDGIEFVCTLKSGEKHVI